MIDPDAAPHVIDLTGQTTLEMLAGVLGIARACVANDSGAMHMAAAVGTPLVAHLRSDARVRNGAADAIGRARGSADAPGLVPSLHASRMSDRPPVHEGDHPRARARGGHVAVILNIVKEASGVGCCAAALADRSPSQQEGRRRGRCRRGRVRVRQGGARLARGAGADPRVRLHRDRPWRRRQRGQQHGRARRPGDARRGRRPRRARPAGRGGAAPPRRFAAPPARGDDADAGQDTDPCRRHSFRQAAGRADRSRRGASRSTPGVRAVVREGGARGHAERRRGALCPTTAPDSSRRRSCDKVRRDADGARSCRFPC